MTDKTELQVEREREGDFGVKKSTRPHSLSRLPRLKLVWIGTCENERERGGAEARGKDERNQMRARVAGCESLRPMSPSSVVLSPSSAVGLMMRAPRFTNCRVERVRRASRVGRGEEMRGCDDCREPEGEIERRPPRLPPRVKRARLLSEKTNRILTSIHVLYLRVCVRASPRSRCLCRDGRKGEPDLFSCAAKPT